MKPNKLYNRHIALKNEILPYINISSAELTENKKNSFITGSKMPFQTKIRHLS